MLCWYNYIFEVNKLLYETTSTTTLALASAVRPF